MKARIGDLAAVATLAVAISPWGCGGALYSVQINGVASKVAEAKELGAEKLAAYEYYFANEHLQKAMSEASEGDYSDAIQFADVAEEYANKAIQLAKEAHRGAGR
jgi:Domain of unknown function (DUF4398)